MNLNLYILVFICIYYVCLCFLEQVEILISKCDFDPEFQGLISIPSQVNHNIFCIYITLPFLWTICDHAQGLLLCLCLLVAALATQMLGLDTISDSSPTETNDESTSGPAPVLPAVTLVLPR